MFGRRGKDQEAPDKPSARYAAEEVAAGPGMVKRLNKALETGSGKGWRLLEVTASPTAGTAFTGGTMHVLFWDTRPTQGFLPPS